ncbi:MAG: hypothetical protein MO852_10180 [Candidatus Devosia euplotis]|nr:hypothetical protein [Candidatus Devosia euplotis]
MAGNGKQQRHGDLAPVVLDQIETAGRMPKAAARSAWASLRVRRRRLVRPPICMSALSFTMTSVVFLDRLYRNRIVSCVKIYSFTRLYALITCISERFVKYLHQRIEENSKMSSSISEREECLTIIALTASEAMAQFSARGLASQGYAIAGKIGRHQFSLVGGQGSTELLIAQHSHPPSCHDLVLRHAQDEVYSTLCFT